MNIVLWILQGLLALHTATGAVWKLSNSEQSVPTLAAIPHGGWLALAVLELLCSLALIAPLFSKKLAMLAPVAAGLIAVEMLLFIALHLRTGASELGSPIYWLVVALLCVFIAVGRFWTKQVVKPLPGQ